MWLRCKVMNVPRICGPDFSSSRFDSISWQPRQCPSAAE